MQLNAGCRITFEAIAPTPLLLMLRPRSGNGQWVMKEEYLLEPHVPVAEFTDAYGNLCQRLIVPEGTLVVKTNCQVEAADDVAADPGAPFVSVESLPERTLQFLLPSRYCQSDRLGDFASDIVVDCLPGYDQVEAIRRWIQQNVTYAYGTSDTSTSALETLAHRVGVCRDFAHLGMALCRSLNIPARMVVGYLHQLKPMDLHAWFEAYVGDRWYTFDATQPESRGNRITIAHGRDAADVALATQFGPMVLIELEVWVSSISP
jgi:transglutaminase-like putative cysteine protease